MDAERWRNLERLYHTALERVPEERGKFIAEACQGDDELRRELESLLRQDVAANSPLDRPRMGGRSKLAPGCTYRAPGAGDAGGSVSDRLPNRRGRNGPCVQGSRF